VDSELIGAAAGAIAVLAVGLVTSFTTPSIILLPALLAGAALALPPRDGRNATQGTLRIAGLSLLATSLVLTSTALAAEFPLNAAVGAAQRGDVNSAQRGFTSAQRLRPWDGDIAQIAAQSMAQAADAGSTEAAPLAIAWANDSLKRTPGSLLSGQALATALMSQGALDAARTELEDLQTRAPFNPKVAHRLGGVLAMQGDLQGARRQLELAADMAPNDTAILSTLGYVYTQLGADEKASATQKRIDALASK
jgi:tetratricopeptide (TPR) repeat protein